MRACDRGTIDPHLDGTGPQKRRRKNELPRQRFRHRQLTRARFVGPPETENRAASALSRAKVARRSIHADIIKSIWNKYSIFHFRSKRSIEEGPFVPTLKALGAPATPRAIGGLVKAQSPVLAIAENIVRGCGGDSVSPAGGGRRRKLGGRGGGRHQMRNSLKKHKNFISISR